MHSPQIWHFLPRQILIRSYHRGVQSAMLRKQHLARDTPYEHQVFPHCKNTHTHTQQEEINVCQEKSMYTSLVKVNHNHLVHLVTLLNGGRPTSYRFLLLNTMLYRSVRGRIFFGRNSQVFLPMITAFCLSELGY